MSRCVIAISHECNGNGYCPTCIQGGGYDDTDDIRIGIETPGEWNGITWKAAKNG